LDYTVALWQQTRVGVDGLTYSPTGITAGGCVAERINSVEVDTKLTFVARRHIDTGVTDSVTCDFVIMTHRRVTIAPAVCNKQAAQIPRHPIYDNQEIVRVWVASMLTSEFSVNLALFNCYCCMSRKYLLLLLVLLQSIAVCRFSVIRYDTIEEFNVHSKAD